MREERKQIAAQALAAIKANWRKPSGRASPVDRQGGGDLMCHWQTPMEAAEV